MYILKTARIRNLRCGDMLYSKEETTILKRFFSNTHDDVFVLVNLPEVIKGTLFSRYSRTGKDLRRLFLDEFYTLEDISEFISQHDVSRGSINVAKAEDFYERILVGFGDDSVAELGGAHVAIENLSVLATKSIEEHRIGLSPLEKSTRYVYFDKKVEGEYLFYKDENIINSSHKDLYLRVNNLLFDTYAKIVRQIQPILKQIFPGNEDEAAYRFSIRAKACDTARALLPLSAKTNMGIFGNGRAFEYLLTHLFNDPLEEVRQIATKLNDNLRLVIPAFIKRASNERGKEYRKYLQETEKRLLLTVPLDKQPPQKVKKIRVKMVDYEEKPVEKIIAAVIYRRTGISYREAIGRSLEMREEEKEKVLRTLGELRQSRHHKPGREFEEPYFSFEITADWGVYKDLMRHRMLTRYRQLFTNSMGYSIPYEIKVTGFEDIYCQAMEAAVDAYQIIKSDFPDGAQYLVTHGAYNRFYLRMNLREIVHLCELRSAPQGHPWYRKVAQLIAKELSEKFPALAKYALPYVDYKDYNLERLEAFRRLEKKAAAKGVTVFTE